MKSKRNLYKDYLIFKFGDLENALKQPPKTTLKGLHKRGKYIITSDKWDRLDKEAHNKAFTVANIMKADILQEVYNYINEAVSEGLSLSEFKKKVENKGLINRMTSAGWTGGDNPARLRVIFDTNVKMSYAKGKYQKLKLISDTKPYWIYHQIERNNKRDEHSVFNGRKYKHDDPIWNTIFPPSDFNCGCWVEATDDATGIEDGSDYTDYLNNNKEQYQLSPLKAWTADVTKYNRRLQKQLLAMLKNKPHKATEIKEIDNIDELDEV